MKKRLVVLAALIAGLLVFGLANNPAVADGGHKRNKADGVWCYIPVFNALTPIPFGHLPNAEGVDPYEGDEYAGDKLFLTTFENAEWTGVFEGESRDYGLIIADPPLQPKVFAATVDFDSAKVKGKEGGLTLDVSGSVVSGEWVGRFTISGGTGDLSKISGHGSWWGPGYNPEKPDDCGVIYYDVERLRGVKSKRHR